MSENNVIKRIFLILIALLVVGYGFGTAFLIAAKEGKFARNTASTSKSTHFSLNEEKLESIASISEINVEVSSAKVNVISEKRSDIKAHFTGNVTASLSISKRTLETYITGSTLNIRVKHQSNGGMIFRSTNRKLDIYIPSDYNKELKLPSSSGDIYIQNGSFSKLTSRLSSGNLKLGKITAANFDHIASSGNLSANELITDSSVIRSSSGRLKVDAFNGDLKASSSSGDISINYKKFNNNIDIQASSGRVNLQLPGNSEFKLIARASSGKVNCKFPITISGERKNNYLSSTVVSDKNTVTITASSGDINILK